jgi:formate hydrogenlyase subunit 3/multisubunit Na+/H+ antiporter MnhD subunit
MPLATLLLPPALMVAAAALGCGLELAGLAAGRVTVAIASWVALLVLGGAWFAGGRNPLELTEPFGVAGSSLVLRTDAVTVLFGLALLTPVALLLTFQRRSGEQAAIAALAAAAGLATLSAGSVVLTSFGLATCASLVLIGLRHEQAGDAGVWASFVALTAAWLLLGWTAVLLELTGGTSAYGAVPVTALGVPVVALLALASLLCSGLLPWRTWVSDAWTRGRLEAGSLAVAVLVPLGLAPLVRAYGLVAAQVPSAGLALAISAAGVATALGAAIRAQAASTRRGFLAEGVPLAAGMALLALGLGTPLGMVAALAGVASAGVSAGLGPLADGEREPMATVAVAMVTGVPPTVAFGSWLLTVQAAIEQGPATSFLALVAAAAWLLALAAAARARHLPVAPPGVETDAAPVGALAAAGVALAAGVGVTALLALLAIPAAAEVMPTAGRSLQAAVSQAAVLSPNGVTINTASGGWAPALVGVPLVVIALTAAALVQGLGRRAAGAPLQAAAAALQAVADGVVPARDTVEPIFTPPLEGLPERVRRWASESRLPEQYRSLFRPELLERAAATSRPWFWIVTTIVLAIAVTR